MSVRSSLARLIVASCAFCGAAAWAETRPENWAEIAVDDLHFIRATLRTNHPGPSDKSNPAFSRWYRDGFRESLELAGRAENFAGYVFVIRHYMAGFQDNHLGALDDDPVDNQRLERKWPGFILALDDNRFVVQSTELPNGPPVGATLVQCDGHSAGELAKERLAPWYNLWSIEGTRSRTAPFLLIDEGNPFVKNPTTCTFRTEAGERKWTVEWTPLSQADLRTKVEAARRNFAPPVGIRKFGDQGWWISLSSFNVNEDKTAKALDEVVRTMNENQAALRSAHVVVFDVRGNHGGNSVSGEKIAAALWGQPYVNFVKPRSQSEDWRVSAGNIAMVKNNLRVLQKRYGENDPATKEEEALLSGMTEALKQHQIFYSVPGPPEPPKAKAEPVNAKVFFLSDGDCGSACLDFADIVLAVPGVTHVGRTTSADTVYIDNTVASLPSGNGWLGYSMKVHRGRPRGNNVAYTPRYVWHKTMEDTAGLEAWISQLAHNP